MAIALCARFLLIGLVALGWSGAAKAQGSLLSGYEGRRQPLLQSYDGKLFKSADIKVRAYDTFAYTALHGCGSSQMSDTMADVLRPDLLAKSGDKAALNFVLPPLTRYMLEYGECLNADQTQRIRQLLALPQPLFAHGTLNHAIMGASSYFILAEHFPDLHWTDTKGKTYTSAQVMAQYKQLMLSRFSKFQNDGFNEQLSPTYTIANLYPLLNLIDFAQDPDVRAGAERMAAAQISLLRLNSLDGAVIPPLTRENPPIQDSGDPPTNVRDILWLYYGGFGPIGGKTVEPPYAAMLAASAWKPPTDLLALRPASDLPYEVQTVTPSFSQWNAPTAPEVIGSSLIDRSFAIGAGNIEPDPSDYNDHTVAFRILLRGVIPVGILECYQPYWHGNEGEDAWDTDRSSPFQQSFRTGRRGVLLYDIPQQDPYRYPAANIYFAERNQVADHLLQVAECRFPRAADEMDVKPQGVFMRFGRVAVALEGFGAPVEFTAKPTGPRLANYSVIKIHAPRAAIYYQVAALGPADTLARFEERIVHQAVHYDAASERIDFPDEKGQPVHVTFCADRNLYQKRVHSIPVATSGSAMAVAPATVHRLSFYANASADAAKTPCQSVGR